MEKAEENLRYANVGFREGVITASNVLEAQTAWLSARSAKIDAQIDVKLTELMLRKASGHLSPEEVVSEWYRFSLFRYSSDQTYYHYDGQQTT